MEPDCRAIIVEAVRQRGPLTVAEYMDLALYAPGAGYYARAAQRSGRAGDFFTSVDVGPLFGELLAIQFAEMWRLMAGANGVPPRTIDLVEAGAGNGRLSRDILDAARRRDPDFYDAMSLRLVERSAAARAAHGDTLSGQAARLASSSPDLPDSISGVLFANELVDALPVHGVVMTDGGLREVYVDAAGDRLIERVGPVSTDELARYLDAAGVTLEPGRRADISLDAVAWMRAAARGLRRGFLVLVDYGDEAAALYSPARAAGTLTTFHRHLADARDDRERGTPAWLVAPGTRDLTAHVDFTSLRRAAEHEGLTALGVMDQSRFLLSLASRSGLLDTLAGPDRLRDRLAMKTLLLPGGLGSTHSVLVFGRGVGRPELAGLAGIR